MKGRNWILQRRQRERLTWDQRTLFTHCCLPIEHLERLSLSVSYATNNLTNVSRKIPYYPLGPAPNKNIIAIVQKVFNSFLMDISMLGRHCVLGESFRKHWLIVWAWLRTYSLGKKGSLFSNRNREYYPQKDTELFWWFNCYSEYWFSE